MLKFNLKILFQWKLEYTKSFLSSRQWFTFKNNTLKSKFKKEQSLLRFYSEDFMCNKRAMKMDLWEKIFFNINFLHSIKKIVGAILIMLK